MQSSVPLGYEVCVILILFYAGINCFVFFFQAEDGIRDLTVTGVQTCALPILRRRFRTGPFRSGESAGNFRRGAGAAARRRRLYGCVPRLLAGVRVPDGTSARKIGRASCRERV